jgi:hypothetical protein
MSNWIDAPPPYPWHLPLARDLQKRLVNTFYESDEIRQLIRGANAPDWLRISFSRTPYQIWVDILNLAAQEGSLRILLQFIVDEGKVTKTLSAFVKDLLEEKTPPADPSPGGGREGPAFSDGITKEEALLFGEDLSESVGVIADLIAGVERVMKWKPAVCHLSVTADDGGVWIGTGTLLTGNRILTNHHVLYPLARPATAVVVHFNYESDAAGAMIASTVVAGDVATMKSNAADDWATINVVPPVGIIPFDLAANFAPAKVPERALILQHPAGKPKRLAFVRNRISSVSDRRVYYLTDTEGGSSGSPVFNTAGKVVALHRAGGVPQKLIGVDPIKKNEGIRMDVIAAAVLGA